MQTQWQAQYLDGKTALSATALVNVTPIGLNIAPEGRGQFFWPFEKITQTQGFHAGEAVRLENGMEAIVIQDSAFLETLQRFAENHRAKFHDPRMRQRRAALIGIALFTAIVAVALMYLYGIEAIADIAAKRVPIEWEEQLGNAAADSIMQKNQLCEDINAGKAIDAIMQKLSSAAKTPYKFKVSVIENDAVNAVSLPGGRIIVFTGLLELTDGPEELAGVLAHEIQHITKKHATKALIQSLSASLLLSAVTGSSIGARQAGNTANSLMLMKYSRSFEEEADTSGVELLKSAGINPSGMKSFFEKLSATENDSDTFTRYASSHPQTSERVKYLKELIAKSSAQYAPLLPDTDWSVASSACTDNED